MWVCSSPAPLGVWFLATGRGRLGLCLGIFHLAGEHATGGGNVLATTAPNGAGDAFAIEIVAKLRHALVATGAQLGRVGNHVVAYEIHAHMLVGNDFAQSLGVLDVVV